MSIFKSTQTAINPKSNKPVPIWKLDTNTMTVTHFNPDMLTAEHKTYCTDFIRYHVHYSESHYPDRLRRLVDDGSIISYLDDLEARANDAINAQTAQILEYDSEYQKALAVGDLQKANGLANMVRLCVRESVYAAMVYV